MSEKIALFYIVVFCLLVLLKYMRPNFVTYVAFSWFGPLPEEGELLSTFKIRKIKYVFSWVLQFAVYFSLLFLFGQNLKLYFGETFLVVAAFAGIIGIGMAILACIGLSISWDKTVLIGPNPKCEFVIESELNN